MIEYRTHASRLRFCGALLLAGLTGSACGGGGSSPTPLPKPTSPSTPPITVPGAPSSIVNDETSYTTTIGTFQGSTAFGIANLNAVSALTGADAAPGATILYPDGSVQTTNAQGNFDASQSSWTASHAAALAANPNTNPSVIAFARQPIVGATSGQPIANALSATPAQTSVLAYAPAGGAAHPIADYSASIASIDVVPSSIAITGGQTQVFTAVGRYSDGELAATGVSDVAWTVTKPPNCGSPAGTIVADSIDPQRARYNAPGSGGSFAQGCPDLVIATATNSARAQISGGAGVAYYDSSLGSSVGGGLFTMAGTAIANAIVEFYGGAAVNRNGAAITNGSGAFSGRIAYDRNLAPAAFVPSTTASTPYVLSAISPASIDPATQGSGLRTQHLVTANTPLTFGAPPPAFDTFFHDAEYLARTGWEPFPFGEAPQADGTTIAGSLQNLLTMPAATIAGTSGTIGDGPYGLTVGLFGTQSIGTDPYAGYAYSVDPSGNVFTLGSPNTTGYSYLLAIIRGVSSYDNVGCAPGATCYSYTQYRGIGANFGAQIPMGAPTTPPSTAGTALDIEGGWSEVSTGTAFAVSLVENDYDSAHQTVGVPLYTHHVAISQALGSASMSVSDNVATPAKAAIATSTFTRTLCLFGQTGPTQCLSNANVSDNPLWQPIGTIVRNVVRSDGPATSITYALNATGAPPPTPANMTPFQLACPQAFCVTTPTGQVDYTLSIASSAATGDIGTFLAWQQPTAFSSSASAVQGSATSSAPLAALGMTFVVDPTGKATLSNTPADGSTTYAFPF